MSANPLSPRAAFAAQKVFLGTITPSGNTVVERITLGILQSFPQVSMHFSRTPVFGDKDPFPTSYDFDSMLAAARLLSHANPQRILWNGSKAAGISLDLDRDLCARIQDQTGIPGTTSILALEELLKTDGITRYALVSPYTAPYQQRIVECLAREGYHCVAQECAGLADNLSFASIAPGSIAEMLRRAAAAKPQVILSICTNFPAAVVVAEMEAELNLPIWDTTILPVWQALKLVGVDTSPGRAWGRLFER